ncbi:hypothetical protein F4805DRAFT_413648 [Annulohypoxylon moriforme]|nr:hypothetical protein F4805DRAFT_413648 [Annulohypoxylon moriforme]
MILCMYVCYAVYFCVHCKLHSCHLAACLGTAAIYLVHSVHSSGTIGHLHTKMVFSKLQCYLLVVAGVRLGCTLYLLIYLRI